MIEGITVYPTSSLASLLAHLKGDVPITLLTPENLGTVVQ
ncbi:MAG: hypothetical protein AVDCRST_MAG93-3856 [uncultured Chloroflexia bacterium]|uniref:Uncharacterized protein n=1 Tax=uncultured Chloroflexia bacterium TaxID=1672391 RepID=A0A6J4JY32_9CHLR|nr:MAG: hypothetical protein AVDCRST_MAG93-3856 [uncultured Chloroflexia bacterium]